MDKYIAEKPCYFDRIYMIGDEIPANVISPNIVKRLIKMGKIRRMEETRASIDINDSDGDALPTAEGTPESAPNSDDDSLPFTDYEPPETEPEGALGINDFVCGTCGKVCGSKSGLIAHEKSHNRG